jgi:hypothetical protein
MPKSSRKKKEKAADFAVSVSLCLNEARLTLIIAESETQTRQG